MTETPDTSGEAPAPTPRIERRYHILRFVSAFYRVLAYIAAIATVVGVIYGAISGLRAGVPFGYGMLYPVLPSAIGLVYGAILFVTFLATSELILLLIDLEGNTRETNGLLRGLIQSR